MFNLTRLPLIQLSFFIISAILLCVQWSFVNAEANSGHVGLEPPGILIDIGGHKIHLYCKGSKGPLVVIDSGAGGFSLEWRYIQQVLSKEGRVCTYDRAGYGWSDLGPMPRTTKLIAAELHQLLTKAEILPPYIFIGHSFGGYTAQYYARNYKDEVAGMLLIDSSHPEQYKRLVVVSDDKSSTSDSTVDSYKIIQPIIPENYPQEFIETAHYFMSSWKSVITLREEVASLPTSGQQITASDPMLNIPLIILTRGQRIWPLGEQGDASEKIWRQLQIELSEMSQNAIYLVVENSGHHIHLDQPDIVIRATRDLIESIDYDRPLRLVRCGEEIERTAEKC
jgi:pimeloyl-ACP methyl ester carboxylesterase